MNSRSVLMFSTISYLIPLSVASPIFYVSDQGSSFQSIDSVTQGGVVSTFATGLNAPTDLVVDKNGNVFEADKGSGNVYEFSPGGARTTIASGLSFPEGIAIDSLGNIYVTQPVSGNIDKISSGVVSTYGSVPAASAPSALTFDSSGNLFVAGFGNGSIYKITPGGGAVTTPFATGLTEPQGLAFNSSGVLFETDWGSGTINEISSTGVVSSFYSQAPNTFAPYGLTFDSSGNLYVTTTGNSQAAIYEFTPGGVKSTFVAPTAGNSILGDPVAIAFSPGPTGTPEPSTWLGLISGIGVIALLRFRGQPR